MAEPRTLPDYFRRIDALSQHAVGKAARVSQSFISMLAKGERGCSPRVAKRIEKVTGVPWTAMLEPKRRRRRQHAPPAPDAAHDQASAASGLLDTLDGDTLDDDDTDDTDDTDEDDDDDADQHPAQLRAARPLAHR